MFGEGHLVAILLLSVLVNYLFGLGIQRAEVSSHHKVTIKKSFLCAAVLFNLGLLGYFKYSNFFVLEILQADSAHWTHIALPIGISFYTFQCLSYVIDVYRKDIQATKSVIDFGCYVTSFPQLIAGPIVRYIDIEKELQSRRMTLVNFGEGSERFIIGLAKKMLIANTLGKVADQIYALPADSIGMSCAWLAIVCYSLQIYFDFSAYSDMAIGLGKMLGFRFPENFNYPYIAKSVGDFWRRWHISLSTWLRDYLYIPLGGNRCGKVRSFLNLWIVFTLCGLWHGASWSFIFWGAYHGLFLVMERTSWIKKLMERMPVILQHAYLLLVMMIGWVFFRAETLSASLDMLKAAFGFNNFSSSTILTAEWLLNRDVIITLIAGSILSMPVYQYLSKHFHTESSRTFRIAWNFFLLCLVFLSLTTISASTYNPFLYFRF